MLFKVSGPIVAVLVCVGLVSCDDFEPSPRYEPNQVERQKIFKDCMALVPKGPLITGDKNPWNEVIDSCASTAYYQSMECVKNCPQFIKKD